MANPKILVIPGSTRTGSHNVKLAALAEKELTLLDADVTRISLLDYPLPIYDADADDRGGQPPSAVAIAFVVLPRQHPTSITMEALEAFFAIQMSSPWVFHPWIPIAMAAASWMPIIGRTPTEERRRSASARASPATASSRREFSRAAIR